MNTRLQGPLAFLLLLVSLPAFAQTEVKLLPDDLTDVNDFGYAVALEEDVLLVGAPGDNSKGLKAGAAYVFAFDSGTWTQVARLTADDAAANAQFGFSVALSGTNALIGAPGDSQGASRAGAAYLFRNDATLGWVQEEKFIASDASPGDRMGEAVGLFNLDALLGAPGDNLQAGSVYNFRNNGIRWQEQSRITSSNSDAGDRFGQAIDMTSATAVIGAPGADEARGQGAGLGMIFSRGGSTWVQTATLTNGDAATGNALGTAVAIDEGDTEARVLLGAPFVQLGGPAGGTSYVYERRGEQWSSAVRLTPDPVQANALFGSSLALLGNLAAVGAPGSVQAGSFSGSVFVYERDGSGLWQTAKRVRASDGSAGAVFGRAVAMGEQTLVVGAPGAMSSGGFTGAVYVYDPRNLPVATEDEGEVPRSLVLDQNYPNPFNPSTMIRYALSSPGAVRLSVHDVLGREVAVLVDARQAAGQHEVTFEAGLLPSGVYLYRVETSRRTQTRRMLLVK